MKVFQIEGNQHGIKELMRHKDHLVPLLGSGFSRPACPTWSGFLDHFFMEIKGKYFLHEDEEHYRKLRSGPLGNRFEMLADFLISRGSREAFENSVVKYFTQEVGLEMRAKFQWLHVAFPGLKVTLNVDTLIEKSSSGSAMDICRGNRPEELERLSQRLDRSALLHLHGSLLDPASMVLTTQQQAVMYGDTTGFSLNAPLPAFLKHLFTWRSVLFIGCSMQEDRILMVLKSLDHPPPHFAVLKCPEEPEKKEALRRRLEQYSILPLWVDDYRQIEFILQLLGKSGGLEVEGGFTPLHESPFVGRQSELAFLENIFKKGDGGLHVIRGKWLGLEKVRGTGKTTLAIEAARRFGGYFPGGVLPVVRISRHNPMTFAKQLAQFFEITINLPPDATTACQMVTFLLKDRRVLLILDNVHDWEALRYILPQETRSIILITTRNPGVYDNLRDFSSRLKTAEILVEGFREAEVLELFQVMLHNRYSEQMENVYIEIARSLGFLPIALRQAISLMIFSPRYSPAELRDKLMKETRLESLRKGEAKDHDDLRAVETVFDLSSQLLTNPLTGALKTLALGASGPMSQQMLAERSGDPDIRDRLERLFSLSWCERYTMGERRTYELHPLVRKLINRRFGKHH